MKKVSHYSIIEKLGDGTNGSVFIVEDENGVNYILKLYKVVKRQKDFINEIEVLKVLNGYKDAIKYIEHKKYKDGYYILFEYRATKSLQYYRKNSYIFTAEESIQMVKDVASQLKYLYDHDILHTDLMASNVVYDGKRFLLIDFGNAKFGKTIKNLNVSFNSLYVAPELYDGVRTIKSEIYSLGCILYYMVSQGDINGMFNLTTTSTKAEKIYAHNYLEPSFTNIPLKFIPLIKAMVSKEPSNRLGLDELLSDNLEEHIDVLNNKKVSSVLDIYQKMADDNIEYGLYKMGLFYEKGYHVVQDINKAKEYYQSAIFKGSAKAYFHLARLIQTENETLAQEYFKKAYDLGIDEASLFLEDHSLKISYLYKEYEKAKVSKNYASAIIFIQQIIDLEPKASYYNLLGILYNKQNRSHEAQESFEKGLILEPKKKTLLMNLADLYNKTYDFDKAKSLLAKLKKYYANEAATHRKDALYYKNQKEFDKAIKAYRKALELRPESAEIKNQLGQTLILTKEFTDGFAYREGRLEFSKNQKISSLCEGSLYQGEDLTGKTIFVYREQGLGDTIHYLRYLPLLKQRCKKLIFRVDPALKEMMAEVDYAHEIITDNKEIKTLGYDYHVSLLSLPYFFFKWGYDIPVEPYLKLPERYESIISVDKKRYNIGIVWEGGQKSENNKRRNVDLKYFSRLFELESVQLYSLQLSRQNETIKNYGYEDKIVDISDKLNSMMDTAKVINELDLVISVDTSVLHLAGALGKKTWLPMQYLPEYRWAIDDEYSYWYPTVKMFRETKRKEDGNWDEVFSLIVKSLNEEK